MLWETNARLVGEAVLDQVTEFRLSREAYHYPFGKDATWWSVLVELESISIDQFEKLVLKHPDYGDDLLIPAAYDDADRAMPMKRQPLVIFARKRLIDAINQKHQRYHVVSILLGASTPPQFLNHAATSPKMPEIKVNDDTVVQAIIDDGIAIAHNLFRETPVSSRIHHATIFEAEPLKTDSHTSVGRALGQDDINALLRECTFDGILDEDLFYAKSGQVNYGEGVFSSVALRRSHGTHVAALAAGHEIEMDCQNRPIICVALPSRIVEDTTGLDLLPSLYLAFHILSKQAKRFRMACKELAPVVFNFSYGNSGGPHDGTGLFATLFELYFGLHPSRNEEAQKAWMTLPVGNNNLAQLHAVDDGSKGKHEGGPKSSVTLDLTVLPDDRTPTQVQIWLPNSTEGEPKDFATINVMAPFGKKLGTINTQPKQEQSLRNDDNKEVARLVYQYEGGTTQRGLVILAINPTAGLCKPDDLSEATDLAPAGVWTIEICRDHNISREPIHIWVRRDETLPGHQPGGRQAFFSNPDYVRFGPYGLPLAVDPPNTESPVRRASSISGFSCGVSPIVVAAYSEKEAELSFYSAAGPQNPRSFPPHNNRTDPDLAAKGDDSYVQRGVISAGSRSGTWVRLSRNQPSRTSCRPVGCRPYPRLSGNGARMERRSAETPAVQITKRH